MSRVTSRDYLLHVTSWLIFLNRPISVLKCIPSVFAFFRFRFGFDLSSIDSLSGSTHFPPRIRNPQTTGNPGPGYRRTLDVYISRTIPFSSRFSDFFKNLFKKLLSFVLRWRNDCVSSSDESDSIWIRSFSSILCCLDFSKDDFSFGLWRKTT